MSLLIEALHSSRRDEGDGCQLVGAAVMGVHFPPFVHGDNLRRRVVPAKPTSYTTRRRAEAKLPTRPFQYAYRS